MRVLMGVDGSAQSLDAVKCAARLLSVDKDEVFLYYSPPPVWVRAVPDASGSAAALHRYLADAVFNKARQQLPESLQQKAQTITGSRDARQGLLIAADECRAELLVIGARGAGPLKQPSIGKTARHIVHHSTIPVLVVRGDTIPSGMSIRVLVASDGSEISRHAAGLLQQFTWPPATAGQAITVLEDLPEGQLPEWLVGQLEDQQLAALGMGHFARDEEQESRLRQEAAAWYETLPAIFQGRKPLVVAGHAGDQILQAIETNRITLVVLGARRQGPIRRVLLGSTSEHVLTHAPCSVLIVRGHEQP